MNPYLEHALETIAIQVELMQEESNSEDTQVDTPQV
jgi:hypothetical protein